MFGHGKRIVQRIEEDPPQQVQDPQTPPAYGKDPAAAPRGAGRVIGRTDDPWLGLQEGRHFAVGKGVVAQGDQIHAGPPEFLGHGRRQAESAGGVLTVGDHRVIAPAGAQSRQDVLDRPAPGFADHVTQEEQPQLQHPPIDRISS